jgi:hypothetical protein
MALTLVGKQRGQKNETGRHFVLLHERMRKMNKAEVLEILSAVPDWAPCASDFMDPQPIREGFINRVIENNVPAERLRRFVDTGAIYDDLLCAGFPDNPYNFLDGAKKEESDRKRRLRDEEQRRKDECDWDVPF